MTNGTLQYKSKTGGGTDPTTGDPIAVTGAWSDCIDCFIQTNHHNTKGKYIDGKFEIADYTVLMRTFKGGRGGVFHAGLRMGHTQDRI